MKKFFTLCAAFAAVMSVSAQEREHWNASDLKDLSSGTQFNIVKADAITTVPNKSKNVIIHDKNDVLPMGTDPATVTHTSSETLYDKTIEVSTASITMQAVATPNLGDEGVAWTFGLGVDPENPNNNKSFNTDKANYTYLDYIKVKSGNPDKNYIDWWEYNSDGVPSHKVSGETWSLSEPNVPAKGAFTRFITKEAGTLSIALFIPKNVQNNPVYVLDAKEDETFTTIPSSSLNYKCYINNNSTEDNWFEGTAQDDYKAHASASNPVFGYLTFNVEANKTYIILSPKTQIGFYGFEFVKGSSAGISDITTDNASADNRIYSISGQQVNDSFRGIVIKNGKKYVK